MGEVSATSVTCLRVWNDIPRGKPISMITVIKKKKKRTHHFVTPQLVAATCG